MAFKISQEFPTASLDITEYFHILHFESLISFKSTYKTASYIMNESKICNKSEFYYSLLKVRFQYTINCFADISTEEAPTVLLGN